MAIADMYDALVSKRVYKESMPFDKADSIIMEGMGSQFDPALESVYVKARPALEEYYRTAE
jgi:putative two-component system response regulator